MNFQAMLMYFNSNSIKSMSYVCRHFPLSLSVILWASFAFRLPAIVFLDPLSVAFLFPLVSSCYIKSLFHVGISTGIHFTSVN